MQSEPTNSDMKLMNDIEFEKLEVTRMLENMLMSNATLTDVNDDDIENIFKKYSLTESESKVEYKGMVSKKSIKGFEII